MTEILVTDVLVVGEGCAGLTAALAASEVGRDVVLLGDGRPPVTAISTGFLTYAAHEGFTRDQLLHAMAEASGKGLCDRALLTRLVDEAPKELGETFAAYRIPVERAERGMRARRALGKTGRDLLSGLGTEHEERDSVEDMTGLMMEFSSTHGTALYAQLRKAVKASPQIRRLKGSALVLEPGATAVGALVDGKPVTVAARAVILATGGLQGLYEFTDTPETLTGDGHGMAAEAGTALVDMEFIQFYPLAVREDGIPPLFLYPDFPKLSTLVNDQGENQMALGPIRDRGRLEEAGTRLMALRDEVRGFGWSGYGEMQEVLRVERGIMLSDCLRQAILRRTESRGAHARSDFPQTNDAWLKKQVVCVVDGMPRFADAPL